MAISPDWVVELHWKGLLLTGLPHQVFRKKHTYAHYLSYATMVSYKAFVGAFQFVLPCRAIFTLFGE